MFRNWQRIVDFNAEAIIEAYQAVRLLKLILALHPKVKANPPEIIDWLRGGKIRDFRSVKTIVRVTRKCLLL